ncbi:MAG: hypothetical protein JSS50_02380 [Proteobacteria bacterium]|nr:hypothetical protein [Pseudomonadota bacterium]
MAKSIFLPIQTIQALNKAADILRNTNQGCYEIVLTRGYVSWGAWRYFYGVLGKAIFCPLYGDSKTDAKLLFSSNGHDDGLSVDVQLYDATLQQTIKFLSWRNIFISRAKAEKLLESNRDLIDILDASMKAAGFIAHPDPREKLQSHYRLESNAKSL